MKNILKIFLRPATLLFLWLTYLVSFFAALVRYVYINNPLAPLPFIGKFSNILWHLSPFFLLIFAVDLLLLAFNYSKKSKFKDHLPLFFVGILSIITFFISIYLLDLELSHYGNYLYVTYGITKDSDILLSGISLLIIVLFGLSIYFKRSEMPKKGFFSDKKIFAYFAFGILVWYSLLTIVKIQDYIGYPKFTYDRIFENYGAIMELKETVPEKGVLIIPPQSSEWPDISNGPIVRYFLFPRTIISSLYITSPEKILEFSDIYFISLHNNRNPDWPQINSKSRFINFGGPDLPYLKIILIKNNGSEKVYKIIFK